VDVGAGWEPLEPETAPEPELEPETAPEPELEPETVFAG